MRNLAVSYLSSMKDLTRAKSTEQVEVGDSPRPMRPRANTYCGGMGLDRNLLSPTWTKPERYRIALVGDRKVGKTAVAVRFLTGKFIHEYASGADSVYQHKMEIGNTEISLDIIDTSGKDVTSSISSADAVVIIFSLDSYSSFKHVRTLIADVRTQNHNDPSIFVVGNKSDMWHYRAIRPSEGERFAKKNGCRYAEVSALQDSEGISDTFYFLAKSLCEKRTRTRSQETIYSTSSGDEIILDEKGSPRQKSKRSRSPVLVRKLLKGWYNPQRKQKEGEDDPRLSVISL